MAILPVNIAVLSSAYSQFLIAICKAYANVGNNDTKTPARTELPSSARFGRENMKERMGQKVVLLLILAILGSINSWGKF